MSVPFPEQWLGYPFCKHGLNMLVQESRVLLEIALMVHFEPCHISASTDKVM